MLFDAAYIGSEPIESIESIGSLSGCLGPPKPLAPDSVGLEPLAPESVGSQSVGPRIHCSPESLGPRIGNRIGFQIIESKTIGSKLTVQISAKYCRLVPISAD